MKRIVILLLLAMITVATSCAEKKESSKKTTSFSSALSTIEGHFNPNSQYPIEVGGLTYGVSQTSNMQAITEAIRAAQTSGIQPVYVNGTPKFRARITGSLYNVNQVQTQQYPQQQYQNQQQMVTVTAIQFY